MLIKEEKWIKFMIKHKSYLVKFIKIKLKKRKNIKKDRYKNKKMSN